MPNYELKAQVMGLGLHQLYKDISKVKYKNLIDEINQDKINKGIQPDFIPQWNTKYSYDVALDIEQEMLQNCPTEWKEASRINHASIERVARLKKRISKMLLSGDCLFLTLTFTDAYLSKTTAEVRRRQVRRYLASLGCRYVANIDYGKKNQREHYHAVAQISRIDPFSYKFGAINFEKIKISEEDTARVAKYISKLTNHAIKETTKQCRLIYSKL